MRRRLEQGLDLHTLSHEQHRALTESLLDEMLDAMATATRRSGGFICDRSPLDMQAFWLYYRFAFDEAATATFMNRAVRALHDLDLVVVLPRNAFALEDDGVRSANPWIQLHFDALLDAMLRDAGDAVKVLRVPATCNEPDARVEAVLAAL